MENLEDSKKLLIYFITINLISGFVALIVTAIFDLFTGLILFLVLIILFPITIQYFYLQKNHSEKDKSEN